jgi:8-oxo-dGTP diphosphatase
MEPAGISCPVELEMKTSREYPDHPLLGVGAVIVQGGRVLLVRRANPPLQGQWSIPGGLVETGESTKEATTREVREETDLEVEPLQLVEVFERIIRDRDGRVQYHFVLIDYLCRIISGEAKAGTDVLEVRWSECDELEILGVAAETCAVIRKATAGQPPPSPHAL